MTTLNKYCDGGEIFCIPLFWVDEKWDPKVILKLKKEDENKLFAFGRAIEDQQGSGILVEIFRITGPMNLAYDDIINSGLLFDPILVFWIGIRQKRWKITHNIQNYDKYIDSNYSNLRMVFGDYDNMRLCSFDSKAERSLTFSEAREYEHSIVWHPIQLERRIVRELAGEKYIHLDTINW